MTGERGESGPFTPHVRNGAESTGISPVIAEKRPVVLAGARRLAKREVGPREMHVALVERDVRYGQYKYGKGRERMVGR